VTENERDPIEELGPIPAAGRNVSLSFPNAVIDLIEVPTDKDIFRFGQKTVEDPAGQPRRAVKLLSQAALLFLQSGV
jgi:hypothetical protein